MQQLLLLLSLGQKAYGKWLFRRMFSGVMVMIGLVLVIAMLLGALLIGGLVAVYFLLVREGIDQNMALMIIGSASILTTALLIVYAMGYFKRLREIPKAMLSPSPLVALVHNTFDSFVNGLLADSDPKNAATPVPPRSNAPKVTIVKK